MASNTNYIPHPLTAAQAQRYNAAMAFKTIKGGWRNKDLRSLGILTPPISGWLRRYVLNGPDFEPINQPDKKNVVNITLDF